MPWGGPRPNSGGARPNSGGARPNSGGARPNSGGVRINSGGARQNSGGNRRNSGGRRQNAGGSRAHSGGARQNAGGARENAGGARENAGGVRQNAGGARINSGGRRSGAGRPRNPPRVPEPDQGTLHETGANVQGPVVVEEVSTPVPPSNSGSSSTDQVLMRSAAPSRRGLYPVYYAWDQEIESARGSSSSSSNPHFAPPSFSNRRCGRCGDSSHTLRSCPFDFWTLRIIDCKYCGSVLMGKEVEGVCCGMKRANGWGVTFKRRHNDSELKRIYDLRSFRSYSLHLNTMFATVVTFVDMSYVRGGGPSFLRLQGNVSMALPLQDSRYSFLWSSGPPSVRAEDQRAGFLRNTVSNRNIRYLVPIIYERLRPPPRIVRERYRTLVERFPRRDETENSGQVEVSTDAAAQEVVVRNYQGEQDARIATQRATGPLPEDQHGRPTQLQAFIIEPSGLFRSDAPVAQLTGRSGEVSRDRRRVQTRVVKYRYLKPSWKTAEKGAFPLLYPYGNEQEPFDMRTYLESRDRDGGSSSSDNPNRRKVNSMTWAEHSKRRSYTDNILLNSGTLLQKWLLRTVTNIEDIRLQFLEKDQMARMVTEQELTEGVDDDGTLGNRGRLYLPDNALNSPSYWKQKRLDVQAMVARRGPPSLFVTITMNSWREEMGRLGLDNQHTSSFTPHGDKPRVFDRPDLVACVYNQYSHAVPDELQSRSEDYFGRKCIEIAGKLEFQERNTPHHHVLLWLEGGVLDDLDEIDSFIRAELPRPGEDDELRALVKRLNIHRHSPYCRGRTTNRTCRFGYDQNTMTETTSLDEVTNRVIYRRRQPEDLKVVPYNPRLTRHFRAHINVERTQGGGAVAYLMKYTFKPPKQVEIDLQTEADGSRPIQNDIRAYMRARIIGAVQEAWRLFEFRNVKLNPPVEALAIHLPGERSVLVRNPRLPQRLNSSTLERYLKRPSEFRHKTYLTYAETTKIYEKLPRQYENNPSSIPKENATPRKYVVRRRDGEECIARIRSVPPANVELFALRLILMHKAVDSFEHAKRYDDRNYSSYRSAAAAMGLYIDGNEFDKAFDEAAQIFSTPSELRRMIVTLYQQGADAKSIVIKHANQLMADINISSLPERRIELLRRIVHISDRHGGRLLREHSFFRQAAESGSGANTELQRVRREIQGRNRNTSRDHIRERYDTLNSDQKRVFDTIMSTLVDRRSEDRLRTDGKAFFLQGHAGTGNTYLLSLLRDKAQYNGMMAEITATTGIASSLYRGGRTLHSLLGIGVEDKDSSERHARISKYGPGSQRGELIRSLDLIIVDEASMMQRILFEHVDVILKDLRCHETASSTRSRPYFGGVTIVFAGDYMQLLPVVPSSRVEVDDDGNEQVVPVNLLDEIPWRSSLWASVKVLRISRQVRQAEDARFADLLKDIRKGRLPSSTPLPLQSTGSIEEAYKFIWRWVRTNNPEHVEPSRLLMASTNTLVDEHNEKALSMFPGVQRTLCSATSIQPVRGGPHRENLENIIVPELTYSYSPTGVPPHLLKLKVGVPVMVIRNVLHPHLLNGKIFVVKYVKRHLLYISNIPDDGSRQETHVLHRINFKFEFSDVSVIRRQFPVRLAFAATVHKGQGQTLKRMIVDLRSNFFSPGQLYVALSRARKSNDVLLLHIRGPVIHRMMVPVANPVLREAIRFVEGNRN